MNLETWEKDSVRVVKPRERRLDARVAVQFKEQLLAVVQQGGQRILIDMGEVQFLDSSGLGAILTCLKTIGKEGDVRLCSLRPEVRTILELTRLDKVLVVYGDAAEALEHYR